MERIDKRRHYILVVDTETANTLEGEKGLDMSNVLVYDCGWQVVDTHGKVYEQASFVNRDIFVYEKELMQSSYYARKIPQYIEDLKNGSRVMASTYEIRGAMLSTMEKYSIKEVAAHNARFDLNALNTTQRWVTKSQSRYWFPFGTEIWCTMRMAESVICKMPTYRKFCEKHNFFTSSGRVRKTAEVLWRFISKNPEFEENHTGLEDVAIESQIMAYCYKQHKKMNKKLFSKQENSKPQTDFQLQFMQNLRQNPCISVAY